MNMILPVFLRRQLYMRQVYHMQRKTVSVFPIAFHIYQLVCGVKFRRILKQCII